MFDKIKELIVDSLGIEEDQITMEASFKEDLKVDSLDLFEMVMSLEDEFGVEIPTEELEKMVTVGDVVNYIEEHKKGISKLVLEKINKNRTFKRHNFPINYLKISKITLCKDRNVLQYVLELKPI